MTGVRFQVICRPRQRALEGASAYRERHQPAQRTPTRPMHQHAATSRTRVPWPRSGLSAQPVGPAAQARTTVNGRRRTLVVCGWPMPEPSHRPPANRLVAGCGPAALTARQPHAGPA